MIIYFFSIFFFKITAIHKHVFLAGCQMFYFCAVLLYFELCYFAMIPCHQSFYLSFYRLEFPLRGVGRSMASLHPWRSLASCGSILISVISSSSALCHDFLGLPRGWRPSTCKFLITDKAFPSSILCTRPNHFYLHTLASTMISLNPQLCATSELLTLSCSDTPESNLSNEHSSVTAPNTCFHPLGQRPRFCSI